MSAQVALEHLFGELRGGVGAPCACEPRCLLRRRLQRGGQARCIVFPPRLPNLATQQVKGARGLPLLKQGLHHEKRLRMCVISVYLLQRLQREVYSPCCHQATHQTLVRFGDLVVAAGVPNPPDGCPSVLQATCGEKLVGKIPVEVFSRATATAPAVLVVAHPQVLTRQLKRTVQLAAVDKRADELVLDARLGVLGQGSNERLRFVGVACKHERTHIGSGSVWVASTRRAQLGTCFLKQRVRAKRAQLAHQPRQQE
jgi:hypothetical protein